VHFPEANEPGLGGGKDHCFSKEDDWKHSYAVHDRLKKTMRLSDLFIASL